MVHCVSPSNRRCIRLLNAVGLYRDVNKVDAMMVSIQEQMQLTNEIRKPFLTHRPVWALT